MKNIHAAPLRTHHQARVAAVCGVRAPLPSSWRGPELEAVCTLRPQWNPPPTCRHLSTLDLLDGIGPCIHPVCVDRRVDTCLDTLLETSWTSGRSNGAGRSWWRLDIETAVCVLLLALVAVLVAGAFAIGQARQAAACERYAGTATPCGSGLVQE